MNYKSNNITLFNILSKIHKVCKEAESEFPYSQLLLCLDQKNLIDLIKVFGGQVLYIPTIGEFNQIIQYAIVEAIGTYEEAVRINPEVLNGFSKSKHQKLSDIFKHPANEQERKKRNRGRKVKPNNRVAD